MKTIWKYPIPLQDEFELMMPEGAELLTAQMQHEAPQMWALVEPDGDPEPRRFRLFGTGHPIAQHSLRYINSFQLANGALVFHLFEV